MKVVTITIPMDLKRRGGRKEIIVPDGLPGALPAKPSTQEPLVTALARAFHWQELIDSGRYATVTELAEALHVDRSYVERFGKLGDRCVPVSGRQGSHWCCRTASCR